MRKSLVRYSCDLCPMIEDVEEGRHIYRGKDDQARPKGWELCRLPFITPKRTKGRKVVGSKTVMKRVLVCPKCLRWLSIEVASHRGEKVDV